MRPIEYDTEHFFSWTSWTFGIFWERSPLAVDVEFHLGPYTFSLTIWWYL